MKTLREYVEEASNKGVAIGHFNISNIEGFNAVVGAARNTGLPVIIGVSEGEREFVGVNQVKALVDTAKSEGLPVFLNADHTYSVEGVKEVIDAGFDAVIFDGAKLSIDENIKLTKECVEYAKKSCRDILVEGELGYIGQSSKILESLPEGVLLNEDNLTKPEDAKKYVEETGVSMLAPAVGNIHGMLKSGNGALNIKVAKLIREAVGIPLVLHGGSGTTDEDFVNAAKAGMPIIHINTEIRVAWKDAVKISLQDNPDEIAPYKILKSSVVSMQKIIEARMRLFNGEPR